jgi:predicted acetyltransferase
MREWISSQRYRAILFKRQNEFVAYALYEECEEYTYLRQFFVARRCRRQGVGRAAMHLLLSRIWDPARRLTVEVLVTNQAGIAFWHAVGYQDYLLGLEITPTSALPSCGRVPEFSVHGCAGSRAPRATGYSCEGVSVSRLQSQAEVIGGGLTAPCFPSARCPQPAAAARCRCTAGAERVVRVDAASCWPSRFR